MREAGLSFFRILCNEPEKKGNKTIDDHLEMNATAASYEARDKQLKGLLIYDLINSPTKRAFSHV